MTEFTYNVTKHVQIVLLPVLFAFTPVYTSLIRAFDCLGSSISSYICLFLIINILFISVKLPGNTHLEQMHGMNVGFMTIPDIKHATSFHLKTELFMFYSYVGERPASG